MFLDKNSHAVFIIMLPIIFKLLWQFFKQQGTYYNVYKIIAQDFSQEKYQGLGLLHI